MKKLPAWVKGEWPDAVMLTSAAGRIEYVNRAFERMTGYRSAEVIGRTPALFKSGSHDAGFYRRLWRALRDGRDYRGVFVNRRKDGSLFHEEESIRALRGTDGRIAYFLCTARDVSARAGEMARLRHSATHDPLTGLPNRALFADRLGQALREAHRRKEAFAVAMLDLDAFKAINTRFGHLAGDAVLKAVATRTLGCVRAIDTVARIGGDELALVLPLMRSRDACAGVLEKIRAANAAPLRYARRKVPVSVSIGTSFYPWDARSELGLRKRADAALFAAKKAGGNGWRFAG